MPALEGLHQAVNSNLRRRIYTYVQIGTAQFDRFSQEPGKGPTWVFENTHVPNPNAGDVKGDVTLTCSAASALCSKNPQQKFTGTLSAKMRTEPKA